MQKKGQALNTLQSVVLSIVVIGFLIAIGMALLTNVQETQQEPNGSCQSAGCNATGTTIDAIGDIPVWLPIIVLAFIALVVLGVIFLLQRRG